MLERMYGPWRSPDGLLSLKRLFPLPDHPAPRLSHLCRLLLSPFEPRGPVEDDQSWLQPTLTYTFSGRGGAKTEDSPGRRSQDAAHTTILSLELLFCRMTRSHGAHRAFGQTSVSELKMRAPVRFVYNQATKHNVHSSKRCLLGVMRGVPHFLQILTHCSNHTPLPPDKA